MMRGLHGGSGGREDKRNEVASLFLYQITDLVPAPAQLVLYLHFSYLQTLQNDRQEIPHG